MKRQKLGPRQLAWVEALESGKYTQGREELRTGRKYCCLGVACQISGLAKWKKDAHFRNYSYLNCGVDLPKEVVDQLAVFDESGCFGVLRRPTKEVAAYVRRVQAKVGDNDAAGSFLDYDCLSLIQLNDAGWSFKQIAALIRKFPAMFFEEPA